MLFIVTADHGMKDSGGHGGVTDAEIHVPLVSVGQTCFNIPGLVDFFNKKKGYWFCLGGQTFLSTRHPK